MGQLSQSAWHALPSLLSRTVVFFCSGLCQDWVNDVAVISLEAGTVGM